MKFICLTLMIISGFTESKPDCYEVLGPSEPVLAFAGEDVILPCFVKPNISIVDMRVEWFRSDLNDSVVHLYEDHDDRNTSQSESYRERTELIHEELQSGNASLKLLSVKVSDEGQYKCFIKTNSWSDSATIDVQVEAVGNPPVITVDGFDASGGLHLKCESDGWFPKPDLELLDSEGTPLSPETSEIHKNKDRFSVKQTTIVYHSEKKVHCRVRLKHHMLEALIITTSNIFNLWRTSAILISLTVVLSGFSGLLIALLVLKYRENKQLQTENMRITFERDQLSLSQKTAKVMTHLETDMVNASLNADSDISCLIGPDVGEEDISDNTKS